MINVLPDPRQKELNIVAPFIEWLRLRADGLAGGVASIDVSGWGGFDLGRSLLPGRAGADFGTAVLHLRHEKSGASLDLGRQYLLLGLGRAEHFDGVHFAQKLPVGLAVELFGGQQAGPRMTWQSGDWLAGGRLSYHYKHVVSAGLSFLQARDGDELSRELFGGDVVVRPAQWVEVGVGGLYDVVAERLAQVDIFSTFYPPQLPGLRVMVDFRRIIPVSFLDKTSIFSVFSDAVRSEVGGDVSYPVNRFVNVRADGHALLFYDGGSGYRAGADATIALDRRARSVVTLRLGRWRDATDGYTEMRAAARHYFTKHFFGSIDGQLYYYDDSAVRGEALSFSTGVSVGYAPRHDLRALIAAEAGISPQFQRVAQLLAKLEWNFLRSY
jgi:hypothetical protein